MAPPCNWSTIWYSNFSEKKRNSGNFSFQLAALGFNENKDPSSLSLGQYLFSTNKTHWYLKTAGPTDQLPITLRKGPFKVEISLLKNELKESFYIFTVSTLKSSGNCKNN